MECAEPFSLRENGVYTKAFLNTHSSFGYTQRSGMSIPDFERAEYVRPQAIEGEVVGAPTVSGMPYQAIEPAAGLDGRFVQALVYGVVAAIVSAIGYALVGLSGFMVSIVAIGMGWLIAKAMMTASGGRGGRAYQFAAIVLTYLSVNLGELLAPLSRAHAAGVPVAAMVNGKVLGFLLMGPFFELNSFNGIIGVVILAIGMRAAWRVAAGAPGFGRAGQRTPNPFGLH